MNFHSHATPNRTVDMKSSSVYQQDLINSVDYHKTVSLLRDFFLQKGFIETPTQSRLSILAACEDPKTIQTYDFDAQHWPLPQTGQMWLEYEMLTKPDQKGFFCISTSYRQEPNPIEGRHRTIFPMFEFETHGGMEALESLERDLIAFLGIAKPEAIKAQKYADVAQAYGVRDIDDPQESQIYKDYGPAFLITHFPNYTSPFWNMRQGSNGEALKIDAILCGQETIGSAERAVDPEEMRHMFHTISDGEYANLLYQHFTKERVLKELDEYLALDFFERCGGGIGVTRMMRALKKCNII